MREHLPEDNYSMWKRHDDRQQAELDLLPRCEHCGEPIQDEKAVQFNDCLYHLECIEENYMVEVVPEWN